MEFNNKWTKEVNDQYRKMIKEKKSMSEILNYFGDLVEYHPKGKFKKSNFLTYEKFILMNEIIINPKYIYYEFNFIDSIRFKNEKDIICYFSVNNIDYILLFEYLIEDNSYFKNEIVYNVFFTTKEQYNLFINTIKNMEIEKIEQNFQEIQDQVEKETNYGDPIKIFNALSYIIFNMYKKLMNPVLMISDTKNTQKINFYNKCIKDSFNGKYKMVIDQSIFHSNLNYYYILN